MSPTIFTMLGGARVMIYKKDHGGIHVHFVKGKKEPFEAECKMYLDGSVARNHGWSERQVNEFKVWVKLYEELIRYEWERNEGQKQTDEKQKAGKQKGKN